MDGPTYDIFSTTGPMILGKSKHMAGVMIDRQREPKWYDRVYDLLGTLGTITGCVHTSTVRNNTILDPAPRGAG